MKIKQLYKIGVDSSKHKFNISFTLTKDRIMFTGFDQARLDQWKSSLYEYEKNKRTRKPFGKDSSVYQNKIVHSSEVKHKQRQFNPILQRYEKESLQQKTAEKQDLKKNIQLAHHLKNQKHQTNYDIINLYSLSNNQANPQISYDEWSRQKNINNPIRNIYNVINNQSIPDSHVKNRNIKVDDRQQKRKLFEEKLQLPEFDIVQVKFLENHKEKKEKEDQRQLQIMKQKLNKSHQFDTVAQRYYNPEQQEKYEKQLYKSQQIHGKDYQQKLPPSYRDRQPYMPSYSQQLISPVLKKIIEKEQNSLKRRKLRYVMEEEYKKRNEEDFEKQQIVLKNRVHEGKILETLVKEYDIINNKLHQMNPSMHYEKKLQEHPYSYNFLKKQNRSHSRSISQHSGYKTPLNNIWDNQSQVSSARSRQSPDLQKPRRFSIRSGGFC